MERSLEEVTFHLDGQDCDENDQLQFCDEDGG